MSGLRFNASLSGEEVKHKSKTVTETREINFPLTVPAGEGRLVAERTTVTSTTTVFESALHTKGTVGIEVDPGIWEANLVYFFYTIEDIFPDAAATSRISRNSTNTDTVHKFLKINQPGAAGGEIVEYHSFNSDIAPVEFEDCGMAVSSTVKDRPPGAAFSPASMKIKVQFAGLMPEVPLERRQRDMEDLRVLVAMNVHPIGIPSAISYAPNSASATFSIPYDPKDITNARLGTAVIEQAQLVQWGGRYVINFS